jgi:signal transduction histidine kinase
VGHAESKQAILNANRHSRAKHIETEIEYQFAELRIAIRDDGCGIDPKKLQLAAWIPSTSESAASRTVRALLTRGYRQGRPRPAR